MSVTLEVVADGGTIGILHPSSLPRCNMRKYWPAVLVVAAMISPAFVVAQQPSQAGAPAAAASAEAQVGTAVVDRALEGAAESFPADTKMLYCHSKVMNATDSEIEHVWYKGDTEVARVKLKIGGSPWRTHSSKNLGENPSGDWRCDVVKDGQVLQSVKFKVQ